MPFNHRRTVILNDYIHVDERLQNRIVFEPLQPLCDTQSIIGTVWSERGDIFNFYVSEDNSIYRRANSMPHIIGEINELDVIVLYEAKSYPEDIYLCVSYELADEEVVQEITEAVNWMEEGF